MLVVASSAGYGATEVGPIAHNGCVNPNVEVGADCMMWTCTHVCVASDTVPGCLWRWGLCHVSSWAMMKEWVNYNQNPVHMLYEEAWPIRTKPYAFDLTNSVFIQSAIECLICTRLLGSECCAGEGMGHMRQALSRTGGSIGEIRVRCKNERSMTAWLHEFSECV